MKMLLFALLIGVCAVAAIHFVRASRFNADIAALQSELVARQQAPQVDLHAVPAIVRAFAARNGGKVGGPAVVEARQIAEMRLEPEQAFFPLVATQLFGTRNPAFVWDAQATMMAIVPVQIVDSYVGGQGLLEGRIAGSITVAYADGLSTARGEAMRFLAELPFNPDAILNAPDLQWSTAGENSVMVSLATPDGPATVRLDFDGEGDIIGIEAPDRPRLVGTLSVPTRWIGRFSDYAPLGQYRLPSKAEIAWILPEGEFVYWRGGMTSLGVYP